MKKYILLLFLLLSIPFFSYAQEEGEEQNQEASEHSEDEIAEMGFAKSLFWEVTRDDLQPFYIFGTMHVVSAEEFEIPTAVFEKMNEVNKIVFELDMDDKSMQTEIFQLAAMPNQTLEELLGEEDYKKASEFFRAELNMSLATSNNMKPFFTNTMLYPLLIEGEMQSYEQGLLRAAEEIGKEIEGLETLAQQIAVFDKVPLKEQADMLMDYINNFKKQQRFFNRMVELYNSKDPEALYEFMIKNMNQYKKYKEDFLDDRNEKWVEQMSAFAMEQPTLFAVGAGHLGGENGLIQLFRREGFTVKPVGQDQ